MGGERQHAESTKVRLAMGVGANHGTANRSEKGRIWGMFEAGSNGEKRKSRCEENRRNNREHFNNHCLHEILPFDNKKKNKSERRSQYGNLGLAQPVSAGAPARYVKWYLLAHQHATKKSSSSFASTVRLFPQLTAASSTNAVVASQHLFIRSN